MSRSDSRHAGDLLGYQVFTVKRPGLTPDIPGGYESLASNPGSLWSGANAAKR